MVRSWHWSKRRSSTSFPHERGWFAHLGLVHDDSPTSFPHERGWFVRLRGQVRRYPRPSPMSGDGSVTYFAARKTKHVLPP
jgi:hypothetical protein